MRILLALLVLTVALPAQQIIIAKKKAAPTCPTGTYVGGTQETFECSAAAFQTYANGTNAHTITDVNSRLSIYDTGAFHGGAHSMGIDTGADEVAYVETDLGGTDNTCSWAFWLYVPSFGSDTFKGMALNEAKIASGTPNNDPFQARVSLIRLDPTYNLRVSNASGTTQDVAVTAAAWYEVQVDYAYGGNIVLSVWDAVGTSVGTATVAQSGGASGPRYLYHGNGASSAGWNMPKIYFDDLKFNPAGGNVYAH